MSGDALLTEEESYWTQKSESNSAGKITQPVRKYKIIKTRRCLCFSNLGVI